MKKATCNLNYLRTMLISGQRLFAVSSIIFYRVPFSSWCHPLTPVHMPILKTVFLFSFYYPEVFTRIILLIYLLSVSRYMSCPVPFQSLFFFYYAVLFGHCPCLSFLFYLFFLVKLKTFFLWIFEELEGDEHFSYMYRRQIWCIH